MLESARQIQRKLDAEAATRTRLAISQNEGEAKIRELEQRIEQIRVHRVEFKAELNASLARSRDLHRRMERAEVEERTIDQLRNTRERLHQLQKRLKAVMV